MRASADLNARDSSGETPLDWADLLRRLCEWDYSDRRSQRAWANDYWTERDRAAEPGAPRTARASRGVHAAVPVGSSRAA